MITINWCIFFLQLVFMDNVFFLKIFLNKNTFRSTWQCLSILFYKEVINFLIYFMLLKWNYLHKNETSFLHSKFLVWSHLIIINFHTFVNIAKIKKQVFREEIIILHNFVTLRWKFETKQYAQKSAYYSI